MLHFSRRGGRKKKKVKAEDAGVATMEGGTLLEEVSEAAEEVVHACPAEPWSQHQCILAALSQCSSDRGAMV